MRADAIVAEQARAHLLARQVRVSRREAREFRLVGADRAAHYWAKRAERLAYRLRQAEQSEE